jgi:hypothetical protein
VTDIASPLRTASLRNGIEHSQLSLAACLKEPGNSAGFDVRRVN